MFEKKIINENRFDLKLVSCGLEFLGMKIKFPKFMSPEVEGRTETYNKVFKFENFCNEKNDKKSITENSDTDYWEYEVRVKSPKILYPLLGDLLQYKGIINNYYHI